MLAAVQKQLHDPKAAVKLAETNLKKAQKTYAAENVARTERALAQAKASLAVHTYLHIRCAFMLIV